MVSIHAPAWGATNQWEADLDLDPVSIHAPAWGATASIGLIGYMLSFNPRPRMGGDKRRCPAMGQGLVSIHAPAWGATCCFAGAWVSY